MTELLITHGANVNAMDLWQFTPLHEAASKSRTEVGFEICSESKVYSVFQVTKFIHAIGTDNSFLLINAPLSSFSVLLLFCSHRLLSSSPSLSCSPLLPTSPAHLSCSPLLLSPPAHLSCTPFCSRLLLTSPAPPPAQLSCLPFLLNSSAHPSCSILLLTSPAHFSRSLLPLTSPAHLSCPQCLLISPAQ